MAQTAEELKAAMLAKAEKEYQAKLAEIDRKSRIMDAMPDAHADKVEFIHTSQIYGTTGSISFGVVDLAGVQEIAEVYTPVPLVHIKGSCRSILPATAADAFVKRYGGDPAQVAPFYCRVEQTTGYQVRLEFRWYTQLADDVLIGVTVKVYRDEVPEFSHRGYAPAWVHYSVIRRGPHTWGDKRPVERTSASLDLTPGPGSWRYASGSQYTPSPYRFYWGDETLTLADLAIVSDK